MKNIYYFITAIGGLLVVVHLQGLDKDELHIMQSASSIVKQEILFDPRLSTMDEFQKATLKAYLQKDAKEVCTYKEGLIRP